ncbi:MAG: Stp1/IreP family PP2C-type Ser/Thr phosphatase [Elusimicrobia bacterium]|nr:Stp1/IreP family PP2C-type Ser/Thr phosphatase [Elusimicrobiota bacterium]
MKIEVFGITDLGLNRENNEDSFCIDETINIFVVADGMGGHASGQIASKMAVDVIKERMLYAFNNDKFEHFTSSKPNLSKHANYLVNCIQIANKVIYESGKNYPQNKGMGTTVVSALIVGNNLIVAHVGDSRLYLIRNNDINPLTIDHSIVMEQVRKGLISTEEASKSDMQNILTRALGTEESVEIDVSEMPINNNDYILLCSDGLLRMVNDKDILKTITELKKPELICGKLIAMANDAGGKDNITVVVAQMQKGISVLKSKIKKFLN